MVWRSVVFLVRWMDKRRERAVAQIDAVRVNGDEDGIVEIYEFLVRVPSGEGEIEVRDEVGIFGEIEQREAKRERRGERENPYSDSDFHRPDSR